MATSVTFRQHNLTRAIKATLAAGLPVRGTRVDPDGTIYVLTDDAPAAEPATAPSAFDQWKARRDKG